MALIIDIIMAIAFIASSGFLFTEKFRNNIFLVCIAAIIAIISTIFLVQDILSIKIDFNYTQFNIMVEFLLIKKNIAENFFRTNYYIGLIVFIIVLLVSIWDLSDEKSEFTNKHPFFSGLIQIFLIWLILLIIALWIFRASNQVSYTETPAAVDTTQSEIDTSAADAMEGTENWAVANAIDAAEASMEAMGNASDNSASGSR